MGKSSNRKNGAPYHKGYGDSNFNKRLKVKYGEFTLESSGKNAFADMQRAGIAASSTYGMMKQVDQSSEFGKMIGNLLFEKLFGGNHQPSNEAGGGNDQELLDGEGSAWIDAFHQTHTMPILAALPYSLGTIIGCFPRGYAEAMLLHCLAIFGALSFSGIRARYLDGKIHSPSIQVVIEAPSGTGKGKFKDIFDLICSRVKEMDDIKYAAGDGRGIVQIIQINISAAKFFQITAANKGVYTYLFHPEIAHAARILKRSSGISYEHLRCAFDNDEVEYNNMLKNCRQGRFRVYMNYTLTGTRGNVDAFIAGQEVDGTAQRICWAVIPEADVVNEPEPQYPEGEELDYLLDQIDEWRKTYCFSDATGVDVPCQETLIDVDYVKNALKDWIQAQADRSEKEGNPARAAAARREAAIGFHLGMVLHMLYDQPTAEDVDDRQNVVAFTLYLADYCMERYLYRFGKKMNAEINRNRQMEQVSVTDDGRIVAGGSTATSSTDMLTPKQLYELYHQNNPSTGKPWSYWELSKAYPGNGTDVTIMTKVNNYAADKGLLVRGKSPKRR